MRIIYFGSPDFAVLPLENLIKNGYNIVAVVTNMDKPVGRKQVLTPTAVKAVALKHNIKVLEYKSVRKQGVSTLKELKPDIMVTCAFGQILSQEILDIPKMTLNIHGSLLPKYRGAAPIQGAIIGGEKETGVTIMKTDIGIDTGDIMFSVKTEIAENETAEDVALRLSAIGAEAIVIALRKIENNKYNFIKQDESKATYVKMIAKEDGEIDFSTTAQEIHNFVRAYNPWPIAFTKYKGEVINVYKTRISDGKGKVGEIISADKTLEIATKNGSIIIEQLQRSGGKKLTAREFLSGFKLLKGELLGD